MPRLASRFVFCLVALFVAAFAFGQQLPMDPALVTGELENGLHYVVRQHAVPPGRAVVWVHMHTGSLNETDRQRGIAHYLEHMAFNGSTNFEPGSLVPFFQSLGMTFGRDQNAFTNYDQTTFQLSLPNAKPETLGKGMMFFADVVSGLSLLPGEIDAERQIILEERRRGLSARQRVGDYIQERMTPGSIYGFRDPIGTEQTIKSVNQQDFKDYYGKWYGPANATVMVIADADPKVVVDVIKQQFGSVPKKARPTPQPLNIKAYEKSFAIVATDPELRSEDVRIVRIEPARPATTTEQQFREELVDRIATSAFNRRMGAKVARGGTPCVSIRAGMGNDPNSMFTAEISARPNPGKWKESLNAMAMELQRARAFGFYESEVADVKKEMMSGAERAVETEATVPASSLISRINGSVTQGEPIMSPTQQLDLIKKYLPTITADEASKKFARELDFSTACFIASLPSGADVPTESQLLEMGQKALDVKPEREAEVAHATQLIDQLPKPGAVKEGAEHAATQVWSGWLTNNVRVHHRFIDTRKDQVSISIALLGGEILETAENRGITSAAQLAWSRPATKKLSSTDIRELMTGKKVNVGGGFGGGRGGRGGRGGGGGGGDSISLSISGSPQELETGFQLAYLLLTEPKIEEASFTQFKTTTRQMLDESLKNPMTVGGRSVAEATYPDNEVRTKMLAADQVDKLTLPAAQAWLEKLIKESPIEVTIVGDLPRDKALDLAARYLGALPSRERVNPELYASLRHMKRPTGPRVIEKTIHTPTDQAFVFSGFYGADESNIADARALNMAARILSTRMVTEVREKDQLVYSIGAGSRTASTYPGFGVFSASAPTEPGKTAALTAKLASMYEVFATDGPTEDEMTVAKKQMANTFEEQMREPGYWAGRLSQLTFRGRDLDEIVKEPQAYQEMTAKQVKDVFAKYWSKQNAIVVVVKPQEGESGEGEQE